MPKYNLFSVFDVFVFCRRVYLSQFLCTPIVIFFVTSNNVRIRRWFHFRVENMHASYVQHPGNLAKMIKNFFQNWIPHVGCFQNYKQRVWIKKQAYFGNFFYQSTVIYSTMWQIPSVVFLLNNNIFLFKFNVVKILDFQPMSCFVKKRV